MERQIEEDQAKIAEDSDGRTSEKPLQAAINRVVKKSRTTPNSSISAISDKAKMLTTGEKAEARIYQDKRKRDAGNTCQEPKRKKNRSLNNQNRCC